MLRFCFALVLLSCAPKGTANLTGVCATNPDPVKPGGACKSACDCSSGACVDGVCCENACEGACVACNVKGFEGLCKPIAAGAAPQMGHATCSVNPAEPCALDGLCDGSGVCRKAPGGTVCRGASCDTATFTAASTCNGNGTCVDATPQTCAPYKCASATACATACAGTGDCQGGSVCTGTSCGPSPLGAVCSTGSTCASGLCVDGACCSQAACGTCKNCGADGLCSVTVSSADDATDTSCNGANTCDAAGACKLDRGEACGNDGQCASGHCTNGVCCDQSPAACGACKRCDVAGSVGTCTGVSDGTDPDNECGADYFCVGGACAASCTCPSGGQCDNTIEDHNGFGSPAVACKKYRFCTFAGACQKKVCTASGGSPQSCGFNIQCVNPPSCFMGTCGYSCPGDF